MKGMKVKEKSGRGGREKRRMTEERSQGRRCKNSEGRKVGMDNDGRRAKRGEKRRKGEQRGMKQKTRVKGE